MQEPPHEETLRRYLRALVSALNGCRTDAHTFRRKLEGTPLRVQGNLALPGLEAAEWRPVAPPPPGVAAWAIHDSRGREVARLSAPRGSLDEWAFDLQPVADAQDSYPLPERTDASPYAGLAAGDMRRRESLQDPRPPEDA